MLQHHLCQYCDNGHIRDMATVAIDVIVNIAATSVKYCKNMSDTYYIVTDGL